MPRSCSHWRPWPLLGLLALLAPGCDAAGAKQTPEAVAAVASSDVATAPAQNLSPTPVRERSVPRPPRPEPEAPLGSDEPEFQPDGVPFPLPNPLPEISRPSQANAPPPQAGPDPVSLWVGGTGSDAGSFTYPRAITASSDAVYVVDKGGMIQKWTHDGELLTVVRTPEIGQGKPTGLSIAPDGNLLVADTHYCRVLIYSPQLELLETWGAPGPNPGQLMMITWVLQADDGTYFTADYGDLTARVQVWNAERQVLRSFGTFGPGPEQFRRPMALYLDEARDELYVADAVNHRIAVFDRQGALLRSLGELGSGPGEFNFPYHMVVDERDQLWVAEFGNQRISVLSARTGAPLGAWGRPGRQLGGLARPWGLALTSRDRVWVLDSGNDRAYVMARSTFTGESQ